MVVKVTNLDDLKILSKLEFAGEQEESIKKDLTKIIGYIKDIEKIDTKGVKPMTHFEEIPNVYREDEVKNCDFSSDLLENAPSKEKNYLCVPKTITN